MKKRLKKLISTPSSYQSLNTIEIDADNITHNFHTLQSLQPNHTIIPVLKSNAYGHGIKHICQILQKIPADSCPLIAVDSYPEYQIVYDYTDRDILILGEQLPSNYHLYDPRRTHFAIGSLTNLHTLIKTGKPRNIHLFFNTGMNREGFQTHEIQALTQSLATSSLTITGAMSHFANADCIDSSYNQTQIDRFKNMFAQITEIFALHSLVFDPTYIHINNSAGITKNHDSLFTASRAGLAFYGYNPLESDDPHHDDYSDLRPALRLTSTITAIQHLQSGESISYGHKWTASEPTTIATIPFGYHEGLPRSLTGEGYQVKHQDSCHPLIGTICMNISLLEGADTMQLYDTIEIISPNPSDPNTIAQLAAHAGQIPYQILVGLHSSIKRLTKKEK